MCFKYPFSSYKCGRCPECLHDYRTEWSVRLQCEFVYGHQIPFFFTLTYDDEHLPFSTLGLATLRKQDIINFFKRLRHEFKESRLKYYICGEYGTKTFRPHYHCIIFGIPSSFQENKVIQILQKAWSLGMVLNHSCWVKDIAQIHYCTKYIINYYDLDFVDREKPFNLKSNGIGFPFVEWALENNYYHVDIQSKFVQIKKDRPLIKDGEIKITPLGTGIWCNEQPYYYEYDSSLGFPLVYWNPLLEEFSVQNSICNALTEATWEHLQKHQSHHN